MDKSPLARLPQELRDTIYEAALTNILPTLPLQDLLKHNGLTRSCRQLRAETLHIFYAGNYFSFSPSLPSGAPPSPSASPVQLERLCALLSILGADIVSSIPCLHLEPRNWSQRYEIWSASSPLTTTKLEPVGPAFRASSFRTGTSLRRVLEIYESLGLTVKAAKQCKGGGGEGDEVGQQGVVVKRRMLVFPPTPSQREDRKGGDGKEGAMGGCGGKMEGGVGLLQRSPPAYFPEVLPPAYSVAAGAREVEVMSGSAAEPSRDAEQSAEEYGAVSMGRRKSLKHWLTATRRRLG